jgi:WD40 repeat protein
MLAELTIAGQMESIEAMRFSPDGRFVAVAGGSQVVAWRVADFSRPAVTWRQHTATVLSLAFSPDGKWLASSDQSGIVRLWETP